MIRRWLARRREPLAVVVCGPEDHVDFVQVVDPRIDARTTEQKLADQDRVNRLGFPRGAVRPL